jgi:hypothetical protein
MSRNQQNEKRPSEPQPPPQDEPQAFINIGDGTPEELAEELRAFGFAIDLIDQRRT